MARNEVYPTTRRWTLRPDAPYSEVVPHRETILLVEDDTRLAELVERFLAKQGFAVGVEARGDRAAERIVKEQPSLVILDIMLPGEDGLSICRRLRPRYQGPVLMLTARGEELDEIEGLDSGADDYLAKPVRPQLLLSRVRALLRRTGAGKSDARVIECGVLAIDSGRRTVRCAGRDVALTGAEFNLLWFLAERAGQVVDRDTLYLALRGTPYDGIDRALDLRVSKIRKKLRDDAKQPTLIKSVRGVGYILTGELSGACA